MDYHSESEPTRKGVKGTAPQGGDDASRRPTPAEILAAAKVWGVTARATKSRGIVLNGPVQRLRPVLWLALRRREAEIIEHLRNPLGDPALAEVMAFENYYPNKPSAAQGPLEPGERRALFEVPAEGRVYLVEVVRSGMERQYGHRIVVDGKALARRYVGADCLPLPAGARRLGDDETEKVRRLLHHTCPRCGEWMPDRLRRGRVPCPETLLFNGDDAVATAATLIERTLAARGPMPWTSIVEELTASYDNPCAKAAAEKLLLAARKAAKVRCVNGGGRRGGTRWHLAGPTAVADLDAELAKLLRDEGRS